jgi:hypothetical protein
MKLNNQEKRRKSEITKNKTEDRKNTSSYISDDRPVAVEY